MEHPARQVQQIYGCKTHPAERRLFCLFTNPTKCSTIPASPESRNLMALVLCTGVDKALLQSRQLILERAGHTVVSATDEQTLITVCQKHSFDVAVIGQAVSPNVKQRIASLVRQHCPETKILELYPLYAGKVLPDADSWLSVPVDVPKDLADRVNELLQGESAPND
jgi:hypothetical protein